MCAFAGMKHCLQPLITSFYHTASCSAPSVLRVCLHAVVCTSVSPCPESCPCQGSDLFIYLRCGAPDSLWQLRSATKCPAILLLLSLPDDFASGSDCLRQSFPRQASSSSSSNHHNNAFLPLMTHWAWLHNSHRHITSTWMRVCMWSSRAINSNIDFSIIFILFI